MSQPGSVCEMLIPCRKRSEFVERRDRHPNCSASTNNGAGSETLAHSPARIVDLRAHGLSG